MYLQKCSPLQKYLADIWRYVHQNVRMTPHRVNRLSFINSSLLLEARLEKYAENIPD